MVAVIIVLAIAIIALLVLYAALIVASDTDDLAERWNEIAEERYKEIDAGHRDNHGDDDADEW